MEAEVEFDEGEEPSFSDPEDFVDDISDQGRSLFGQESARLYPLQAPPSRTSSIWSQNERKDCLFMQRIYNQISSLDRFWRCQ